MFFSTLQCVMCAQHYDMWCVPFNGVQLQMCLVGMRVVKEKGETKSRHLAYMSLQTGTAGPVCMARLCVP